MFLTVIIDFPYLWLIGHYSRWWAGTIGLEPDMECHNSHMLLAASGCIHDQQCGDCSRVVRPAFGCIKDHQCDDCGRVVWAEVS